MKRIYDLSNKAALKKHLQKLKPHTSFYPHSLKSTLKELIVNLIV